MKTLVRSSLAALVLASSFVGPYPADAQDAHPEADPDRACAAYLAGALREVASRPRNGNDQGRAILRVIARGNACRAWTEALRVTARRAGPLPWQGADVEVDAFLSTRTLRPECAVPSRDGGGYVSDDLAEGCRPMHPLVAKLVTTLSIERSWGNDRRLLVHATDLLTAESHRLVPSAQLLWTFANWNYGCVPSPIFLDMEADLRAEHLRPEPYRRHIEEEMAHRDEAPRVARHPAFRRARRC